MTRSYKETSSIKILKKRFPTNIRHELSIIIFKIMLQKDNYNTQVILTLLRENKAFWTIISKLKFFEPYVENYITQLIEILNQLKKYNENYNHHYKGYFSIHKFAEELRAKGITLGISESQLERNLTKLFDYLSEIFISEFKIERAMKGRDDVFNNEILRLNTFVKKFRLIFELKNPNKNNHYNNFTKEAFEGTCACNFCNINFIHLPALEFHHLNEYNKTISYNQIYSKPYTEIKTLLERDLVVPICRNCHEYDSKQLFRDFKEIILKEDLFYNCDGKIRSPLEIDKIINRGITECMESRNIRNYDNSSKSSIKFQVKSWIRKRAIIEQLYNGCCRGCLSVSVMDNLPSLIFHHLSPDKKQTYVAKILPSLNIKEAAELLLKEECTCLCANCHSVLESKYFFKNINKIFHTPNKDGYFYLNHPSEFINRANQILSRIFINIKHEHARIRRINSIKVIDYLEKSFGYGEIWKKVLFEIYNKVTKSGENKFRPSDIKLHNISRYLKILSENRLINLIIEKKGHYRFYKLTQLGFMKINEIQIEGSNIIEINRIRK